MSKNDKTLSLNSVLLVITFLINGEEEEAIELVEEESGADFNESNVFTQDIKNLINLWNYF